MDEWYVEVAKYALVGLKMTVLLSVGSTVVSIIVGVVLGLASNVSRVFAYFTFVYTQIWRGLPVLVTLFMVFFLLPSIGINVSFTISALIGLSLWGSANIAEIVIGAIKSVPESQRSAAFALGFNSLQGLWWVLLPQAMRRMLPSAVGILISLIQATALASAIGAVDLLASVDRSIERLLLQTGESHAFILYLIILLVYFSICFPLTMLSRRMENRLAL